MGIFKSLKKIFKKLLPILPVIFLFAGPAFMGGSIQNMLGFSTQGAGTFISRNLFKALVWGYSIYSALNPPKPPSFSGGGNYSDEPVYSWNGANVTSQSNLAVQVVYGDWWVSNGNVIDKEISTSRSIDPSTSTLYLLADEFLIEGNKVGENEIPTNIRNVTTIESGVNQDMIIGFDEISGYHVWFDDGTNSWEKFDYVSLYNPFGFNENYLIGRWSYIHNTVSGNAHYKFVFTPEENHVLSFMNRSHASNIMFRIDLDNKKVYLYHLFQVLTNETGDIFDFCNYQKIANNSYTSDNFGFVYNQNSDRLVAEKNFHFHDGGVIKKYSDAVNFTYTTDYLPQIDFRYETTSKYAYNQLSSFYENNQNKKIIDAIIHYHEEYGEFTLQLLIEDDLDIIPEFPHVGDTFYETNFNTPLSNRKRRYVIGTRYKKLTTPLTYDSGYVANIQTTFESDTELNSALIDRGFYGMFGEFKVYNSTILTPSDKQTELFNLAYLSFEESIFHDSQHLPILNTASQNYVGKGKHSPFPTIFASIMRDRFPRIEKFSSQPQFSNWYQRDVNGYSVVNKSIGAITSLILMDKTDKPNHVSFSFFSCHCNPEGEKRFDPFFIEVCNFGNLYPTTGVDVSNTYDPNNKSIAYQNLTKSTDGGVSLSSMSSFNSLKELSRQNLLTRNVASENTSGGISRQYYVYDQENYYIPMNQLVTEYFPTRDEIKIDSLMDNYLWDYGTSQEVFFNYINQLQAKDIIYVPEHEYHLVKVDNSWIPIRGWNKNIFWIIQETPVVYYPINHPTISHVNYYNPNNMGYVINGESSADNRTLWYNHGYNLTGMSFNANNYYHVVEEFGYDEITSGYVPDVDGQVPFSNPIIINKKLHWFDNNDIFQNITDINLRNKVSSIYQNKATINYINIGWWDNLTPSQKLNRDRYSQHLNPFYKIPTSDQVRVIYEPISINNTYKVV